MIWVKTSWTYNYAQYIKNGQDFLDIQHFYFEIKYAILQLFRRPVHLPHKNQGVQKSSGENKKVSINHIKHIL